MPLHTDVSTYNGTILVYVVGSGAAEYKSAQQAVFTPQRTQKKKRLADSSRQENKCRHAKAMTLPEHRGKQTITFISRSPSDAIFHFTNYIKLIIYIRVQPLKKTTRKGPGQGNMGQHNLRLPVADDKEETPPSVWRMRCVNKTATPTILEKSTHAASADIRPQLACPHIFTTIISCPSTMRRKV